MANTIQIKRSTNNTVPNSNISGCSLTAGELGYSYSSDDGSGDEQGLGKLFIGHADGLGGTRAAVIVGGSYFTKLLDQDADLLNDRVFEGNIVEGHGDLHSMHIYLLDQKIIIESKRGCSEFA